MQNVSLEHTIVDINGHTCSGWADAADALQFPDQTLANTAVSPDGTMLASTTGMFKQLAQTQKGAVISWEMNVTNRETGWSVRCERGVMTSSPLGQTLGNAVAPAREFELTFEVIAPNYDGARTAT